MAKPNYAFAKRQKELAKKQKKEEKLKRKAEGRQGQEDFAPNDAGNVVDPDNPDNLGSAQEGAPQTSADDPASGARG